MSESVKDRDDRDNRLIAETRHIQHQNDLKDWLAWLETLIQYTDLPMVRNKIKQLKKELGK